MNLVGSLCYLYNASEEDVAGMVAKLNEMIKVLIGSPATGMDGGDIPQIGGMNPGAGWSCL